MKIMNLSYRVYFVWKRNLISYKRFVVSTLLVSLGEPLFYLIAMGLGMGAYMGMFGGKPYLYYLVPGLVITSAMFASAFECLYGAFVHLVHEKLYDSLIVTPASAEDVVAGDIAWGISRGILSSVLMLIVGALLGVMPSSWSGVIMLFLLMVLTGFLFASASMLVTAFAPNFDFFSYYTELVITPMFFFSGVFFPLDKMPQWMIVMANFIPLTHAVTVSRGIYGGQWHWSYLGNCLALLLPGLILFYLAIYFMKRRLIK